jgi:hypothetical protein
VAPPHLLKAFLAAAHDSMDSRVLASAAVPVVIS